ncbi:hypothetical protein [Variovorax sp. PBL-E5]|uniref:hypothetical protein n=1 Tax=Variovorax sp. PBL-E5 TaxID=434014 RepID=UPI0013A56EFB|nr:hypothetical protein [Variovorax sp. PBL-E5]
MFSLKAWMRSVAQLVNPTADASDANAKAIATILAQLAPTGKLSHFARASAPAGWVAGDGGTIGNVGSGATRANVDTLALFTAWWSEYTDALLPIFTSAGAASTRGASAAADWAALKRLTVFDVHERFIRSSGPTSINGTKYAATEVFDNFGNVGSVLIAPATLAATVNGDGAGGTTTAWNQVAVGSPNTTAVATQKVRPINVAFLGCFKL